MWLQKDQGGCEITYKGAVYAWEKDGDVTEVPYELGVDLVNLGGYQVVPEPVQAQEPAEDSEDADDGDDGDDAEGEGEPEGDGATPEDDGGDAGKTPEAPVKPTRARPRKPAS